jgi:sulfite exporter TauE/SafE
MSVFGLFLGIVLVVLGIIFLFSGLTGKGVRIKTAGNEIAEEVKAQKIRQAKRISIIAGFLGIIFGIIGILTATIWAP